MSEDKKSRAVWITPRKARLYFLLAAFCFALPSLSELYKGYEGKFLVASDLTTGTFFEKTVIYIEDHDLFKAHGYIINLPANNVSHDLPGVDELFIGGPVDMEQIQGIIDYDDSQETGFRILSPHDLERLKPAVWQSIVSGPVEWEVRAFSGYAGWAPLQLNFEVLRGGWYVLDYDPEIMFETPPENAWNKAFNALPSRISGDYKNRL